MSLYLLDTDHLSLYQTGHPPVVQNVLLHLTDRLAVSVITVEEQWTGWQRSLRQARDDTRRAEVYRRMARTVESWSGWLVLSFGVAAMAQTAARPAPAERSSRFPDRRTRWARTRVAPGRPGGISPPSS